MKERPILFSASMVRAILAGDKTQTRRIAKDVRHPDLGNVYAPGALVLEHEPQHVIERACPYGRPGDRLWVRETWQAWHRTSYEYDEWEPVSVKEATAAMKDQNCVLGPTCDSIQYRATSKSMGPWTPSIHMPRWACRILLEITGVRVERLQDISQADAYAEGAMSWAQEQETPIKDLNGGDDRMAFMALWESIGGAGSWDANPWVWVIEFRRVK
jgi:hypothetical protein